MKRNDNCIFIGLTGCIGSGKSTVTQYLKSKEYIVIDADELARTVVEPGEEAYNDIISEFGESILNNDQTLNRKLLGKIVFNDSVQREKLNAIVHPKVRRLMFESLYHFSHQEPVVFADIPLLIESDLMSLFDQVWLVYAPEDICIERIIKRDGISEGEARSKIGAQMPIEDKKVLSDLIIDNTSDKDFLFLQIEKALTSSINK